MSEHEWIERRLRDALAAKASTIEPPDRWGSIVDRLERAPSRWWRIPARHPLTTAAAVAAAAAMALLALAVFRDRGEGAVYVGEGESPTEAMVATTEDERLVALDAGGSEVREIEDLRALDDLVGLASSEDTTMEDLGALAQLAVAPDGSRAFVTRVGGSDGCPRSSQIGTSIYEVPLAGGLGGEPPTRRESTGAHPEFSPDGDHVAFVSTSSGDPCDIGDLIIHVKEIHSWGTRNKISVPEGVEVMDLVWLNDRTLAVVLPLGTDGPESPLSVVLIDPLSDTSFEIGPSGLTFDGGNRFGRAADGRLLIAGRLVPDPATTMSVTGASLPSELAGAAEISPSSVWAAEVQPPDPAQGTASSYELLFTLPVEARWLSSLGSYRSAGVAAVAADGSQPGERHDLVLWEGGDPSIVSAAGVVATAPLPAGGVPSEPVAPPELEPPEVTAATLEETSGCSAAGAQPPSPQADLPEPVAATRLGIAEAARSCDFKQLETYAAPGFTASFGGGDPGTLWREAEQRGEAPMLHLVGLLDLPHITLEIEGTGTVYVWPSAYAYAWSEIPEADLEALRSIYGDDEMSTFEAYGSYIGYRVGIAEDGTWLWFVEGD